MPKIHEIIDSLNDENVSEIKEQLKTETDALENTNKQLYSRAKKAEGFEQKDGKWIKVEKPEPIKPSEKLEQPSQSNEPDYAKIAFLEQRGLNHSDDQKFVQNEATRLKLPLTDILSMEYVKSKLKSNKDQREAESGMPIGSEKSSGATKNSVDYWINKKNPDGTFSTPDDLELAEKVINSRIKQHVTKNKFADDLY